MFTTDACTRETTCLCVFCWLLGSHAYGNKPKWNFRHVGIFSAYQTHTAYKPVTLTGGVNKLVLEGGARAKYDSNCYFWQSLSVSLDTHEPQAYRIHAPVVNAALESLHFRRQVSALVTLFKLIHMMSSQGTKQHAVRRLSKLVHNYISRTPPIFHLSLFSCARSPNKLNINYHGVRFSSLFSTKLQCYGIVYRLLLPL